MPETAEVVLRGVLDSLSPRFYTGGWGWGTLSTDQGQIKITGTLEGHVTGTSLVVRGAFRETQYGRQLSCTSIVVDAVTGSMEVIRAWLKRYCPEAEPQEVLGVVSSVMPEDRWELLSDAAALSALGLDLGVAIVVAEAARDYLALIELKRMLLERGFHDAEADRLIKAYADDVHRILDQDPWRCVIDQLVPFSRMDTLLDDSASRNAPRRLQAAVVQALVNAQKNGHTARLPRLVIKEASEMAGVYPEQVKRVELPDAVAIYEQYWQLRSTAYLEQAIAVWVVEAMRRS